MCAVLVLVDKKCLLGFLHNTSVWEDYSLSLLFIEFIYTRRVYFYLVFCCTSVCNSVHRVICDCVPSTVITLISVLY